MENVNLYHHFHGERNDNHILYNDDGGSSGFGSLMFAKLWILLLKSFESSEERLIRDIEGGLKTMGHKKCTARWHDGAIMQVYSFQCRKCKEAKYGISKKQLILYKNRHKLYLALSNNYRQEWLLTNSDAVFDRSIECSIRASHIPDAEMLYKKK